LGSVSKVISSPDGKFVFSCGTDGSIFIYNVCEITSEGRIIVGDIKEEGKNYINL